MEDYIIGVIEEILNGVTSMGGDGGLLVQTPAQFNSAIYSWVQGICQSVAMPVAYIVLALIFTLELYNASTRIDGAGGGATFGAEIVFKTMIKFVLCKLAVDMTPQILGAIFELSSNIIGNISGGAPGTSVAADLDALRASISGLNGIFPKLFLCLQVTIIWIVFKFSSMLITVVVIGRMVEIYIYTAIAAVPIATLGGGDLGLSLCQQLAGQPIQITLVEKDPARCALISAWFEKVDVCQGDATNHPFLQTLNFDAMDAVMAVTGSDEINAMLALYGRSRGLGLVFCRQNTHSYLPILQEARIRTVMPKDLATEQILGYVRSVDSRDENPIVTLHALAGGQIEALEFEIGPDAQRIIAAPLQSLPLKKNILIAAILRHARMIIPGGQDQLRQGDFIIVLAPAGHVRRLADLLENPPRRA